VSADDDQLVFDYLRQLREAASGLPDDRRDELVGGDSGTYRRGTGRRTPATLQPV